MKNLGLIRRILVATGVLACLAFFGIFALQGDAQKQAVPRKETDEARRQRVYEARMRLVREDESNYRTDGSIPEPAMSYSLNAPMAIDANPLIYVYEYAENKLATVRANAPGTILSNITLTGLEDVEYLAGIDFNPADGFLYGVTNYISGFQPDPPTNGQRVVRINTTTGAVTDVAPGVFFPSTYARFEGLDFNPTVNRIRYVTDELFSANNAADSNRRYHPDTGQRVDNPKDGSIRYADGSDARLVHVAYTNNDNDPATGTTLFGIDSLNDRLVRLDAPNTGILTTVGSLGIDVGGFGGFDIQRGTNLAYAALRQGAANRLHRIDLTTGAATLIGTFGLVGSSSAANNINGIAIAFEDNGGTADLSITKTNNQTGYTPGSTVTYTVVVSNPAGADPVANARVTDTLPAAFTNVSFTCVGTGAATCSANGTGNAISDLVTLPGGTTVTYTITATIAPGTTGDLSNTASVTSPAGIADAAGNNSQTDTDAQIIVDADLSITKTDGNASYTPGGQVTYTITASNAGPAAVTGATVTDNFPAAITGVSYTCTSAGGGVCPAANGNGNINATVNLPVNGSVTFTATGTVAAGTSGTLSNTATVTAPAGITEVNPNNNSATDTTPQLIVNADLAINKTSQATYTAGGQVTYTITASNAGPSAVTGATVTDTFPASVTNVSYTCSTAGGGGTCTSPNGTGNINTTVNLPAGGSVTFTATGTVAAGTTGTLSNTATVTAPAGIIEVNAGNNSSTATTAPAVVNADLRITKTNNQTTYTPGSAVTYTITAFNDGPSAVTGATVTDNFPAALTNASFTCTGSNNGTCPANGTGNINASVDLPSGSTVTFTVNATISANATGDLSNTATITAPAGITDTNPANNSQTDTDTLAAVTTDLSITKTNGQTTYAPGSGVAYTIVATNNGPGGPASATITDTFPASITDVTFTCTGTNGGTCAAFAGSGNINAGVTLPSGGSVTIVATGTISPNAVGNLSNTATITGAANVTDSNPGNNSQTDTDTLRTTAAEVEVTGRVLDNNGRGLRNTRVTITDTEGNARSVMTDSFGFYKFTQVESGAGYVIAPVSSRYKFRSKSIEISDSVSELDFAPEQP